MIKENREISFATADSPAPGDDGEVVEITGNCIGDIYQGVRRALLTLREDESDESSELLFRHIAIDTGQYERLMNSTNTEFETPFPACFVRFVNVRYLVAQSRVGEGRATMRVRFILNRVNSQDPDYETEPFHIFERINRAIQDAKETEPALQERCNLQFFDMPGSTNQLQAYWVDYEVWFTVSSAFKYRNWIERKIVLPEFTNYSDIEGDTRPNLEEPTYGEQSGFESKAEEEKPV